LLVAVGVETETGVILRQPIFGASLLFLPLSSLAGEGAKEQST